MFYFTVVAVMSYGYALADMFGTAAPGNEFPAVSSGLLGLLGISHAGYLAEKAMPHTQEPAPEPPAAAPGAPVAPAVPTAPAPAPAPAPGAPVVPAPAPAPAAPTAASYRTARKMGTV